MSAVALCISGTVLTWDTILIALAVPACFLALWSAYGAWGGRAAAVWALLPLSCLLSPGVSRLMFWYCHQGQFSSLAAAFAPGSAGGFCLSGVVMGFVLAVTLLRLARLVPDEPLLLDCAAPGLALGLSLLRLSALFNGSCRGKAVITDERFQKLPFAAAVPGGTEFRFASFFIGALLFLIVFGILCAMLTRRRGRRGDVFLIFLLLYSAVELLIDSSRNDATYFHLNAFVSVAQILSGVTMLGVLIVFARRSARAGGGKRRRVLCCAAWFLGLCFAGFSEYLVQRHGNWQLGCYTLMSIGALILIVSTLAVYRPVWESGE